MSTHPMLGDTCFIHHVEESGEGFLRCFECGHLYRTEQELVDAYMEDGGGRQPVNEIYFCPHCLHDF